MDDISITIATENDLENLVDYLSSDVIDKSFVKPLSERGQSIRNRVYIHFNNGYWIILRYNNKIYGCVSIIIKNNMVELSTFSIHPDLRHKHIGEKLIMDTEIIIKELFPEITYITIDSWEGNEVMKNIMVKFNYIVDKIFEDNIKRPPGINTILYIKKIR